ncbi:MAG: sigma factor-like helix-turn-helix DNA-binding protein [Bacilli bacterium]|nr:hypothetical protein [Erysipelotrichaceae bacterium]MDY4818799.1 sigma factor-like helix-turn-helix DNA-binding protein [Bacilli bacterium]MDY5669266.1 sigma factor-like helix-turn-helix DNA-binding protein [Bacilli bacterium]
MNENLEEIIYLNNLFDLYQSLLTPAQSEIFNEYYNDNLSLSEISEIHNISRSAASYSLKLVRKKLEKFEAKLHLNEIIEDIKKENKEIANKIESRIKNGI